MKTMNKVDLANVLRGACFLGSGGGGAYETGYKLMKESGAAEAVRVVSMDEAVTAGRGKYGVVTAVIGSPEKMKVMTDMQMNVRGVKKLAEAAGIAEEDIYCIVPGEIGAVSSIVACLTAAEMGIPVLDADGTGRATPKINMTTFAVTGTSVNPTVLTSLEGDSVTLNIQKDQDYSATVTIESLARSIVGTKEFGEFGGFAIWIMKIEELPVRVPIQGTLSAARELGEALQQEMEQAKEKRIKPCGKKLKKVLDEIGYKMRYYAEGKLRSAETTQKGGFDHGIIKVDRTDKEGRLTLIFQNESLLAWEDNRPAPVIVAPDLISYLVIPANGTSGQWIYSNGDIMNPLTGRLRSEFKDAEITVIGMLAPAELRNLETLRRNLCGSGNGEVTVGDSYKNMLEELGYYGEYIPLEEPSEG